MKFPNEVFVGIFVDDFDYAECTLARNGKEALAKELAGGETYAPYAATYRLVKVERLSFDYTEQEVPIDTEVVKDPDPEDSGVDS